MFFVEIPLLNDINVVSISVRIILAIIIGGILGIERGRKHHPAGFRTHILVCLGAAMVMMTNQFIVELYGGDPSRLGAQVVSGIGFLGAGTIIITRRNQVKGLTTAAGLWAAACLGLAVGIGFYEGAILVGFVVLLIMTVFQKVDMWFMINAKYMNVYVSFESMGDFDTFLSFCSEINIKVLDVELSKSKIPNESGVFCLVLLENRKRKKRSEIIHAISNLDFVKQIEEL